MTVITDLIRVYMSYKSLWLCWHMALPWGYGCCHGGVCEYSWGERETERQRHTERKRKTDRERESMGKQEVKGTTFIKHTVTCLNSAGSTQFWYACHCCWTSIASVLKGAINWVGIWLIRAEDIWELCFPDDSQQQWGRMCSKPGSLGEGRADDLLTKWKQRKQFVYQ